MMLRGRLVRLPVSWFRAWFDSGDRQDATPLPGREAPERNIRREEDAISHAVDTAK